MERELYIGELNLGPILPEDIERFKTDLQKVGYEVVEAKDAEPDTYDIHKVKEELT